MHDRQVPQQVLTACERLGPILRDSGRRELQAQYQQCLRVLRQQPHDVVSWNRLALLAEQCGRRQLAEVLFRFCVMLNEESAILHGNLGNILKAQGKYDEAVASYKRALALEPHRAEYYLAVAEIYRVSEGGDAREIAWLRRAVEQCPDSADLLVWFGEAVKRHGNTLEAQEFFRKARALSPTDGYIHQTLAHTKKFTERDDADLTRMEALLSRGDLKDQDRCRLHFALGKAYEDLADYDASFVHYEQGNALYRATFDYDIEAEARSFGDIRATFTRALFGHGRGCDSRAPIFILGMPRSGSTLLEQMLAAHPLVHGAGELPLLGQIMQSLWARNVNPAGQAYPRGLASIDEAVLRDAGQYYAHSVEALLDKKPGARYVTDKMPHNFLYVGMIKLLLPNARIIHCRREPMDTCFSCYKHLFSGAHPYAYDLRELGSYYKLYEGLMAHWHEVLPGEILDVDYEAVVEDQEGQLARLLGFCGLPWDDACLAYHETGPVALTASSVQVRRPIYKDSLAYWRRYEAHLTPLREALRG